MSAEANHTAGEVTELLAFTRQLPPPPPPELDRYLDAVASCLTRFGLSRTSITDIATEARVSRTTVRRQLGSVENAMFLLASRDMHRFVAAVPAAVASRPDRHPIATLLGEFIAFVTEHPVPQKLMREDQAFLVDVMVRGITGLLDGASAMLAPILQIAADGGAIRTTDAHELAGWLIRVILILLVAPPTGDLDSYIDTFVMPGLLAEPAAP